jgi:hypothetical protein
LLAKLNLDTLNGLTFLDIGSGSGLHSLAALRSGAAKVLSFDYDAESVAATRSLRRLAGNPEHWTVVQGSVLDKPFMHSLGKFDIIYSWGVLHHTGDMYGALRNAVIPLCNNGVFFIALYSDTAYRDAAAIGGGAHTPEEWLNIKQYYNKAPYIVKKYMEYKYIYDTFFMSTKNPVKLLNYAVSFLRYKKSYFQFRGMDYLTDVRDWLGGYPMEFVKEAECVSFCAAELGLEPLAIHTGEGNTEFLFRPEGASNYWDALSTEQVEIPLDRPYEHVDGYMWSVAVPDLKHLASGEAEPRKSAIVLTENGRLTGYRNALHEGIRRFGEGRYSHWGEHLLFSTPDNSSPNDNGRRYALRVPAAPAQGQGPCAE